MSLGDMDILVNSGLLTPRNLAACRSKFSDFGLWMFCLMLAQLADELKGICVDLLLNKISAEVFNLLIERRFFFGNVGKLTWVD